MMRVILPRILGQRGDTIIEVMIVLAVLGLALSISYATANRSLLNTRQAQENAAAAELAQSQVEALRVAVSQMSTNPTAPGYASYQQVVQQGKQFCMNGSSIAYGGPSCQNINNLYNISVVYGQPSAADTAPAYQVVVAWPDVEGQGQDTVTLDYRMQPML